MPAVMLQRLTAGWPRTQRTAAVGLVLMQALAMTLVMQPVLLPVLLFALAGWVAPQFKLVAPLPIRTGFAALFCISVIRFQFRDEEFTTAAFIGTDLAYEIACYCIACQLYLLFVQKYAEQLPDWYLAISGTGLVFAGDIRVTYQTGFLYLFCVMAYFAFWGLFAIASRAPGIHRRNWEWSRSISIVIVVLVSLGLTYFLSVTFQRHANQLEYWVSRSLFLDEVPASSNGFSGSGGLFDITHRQETGSEEVALSIRANFRPEYLRGRVFSQFSRNRWETAELGPLINPLRETRSLRALYPDEKVYLLQPDWPAVALEMTVWPLDRNSSAHFFLPLEAAVLACSSETVHLNQSRIAERSETNALQSYLALIGSNPHVARESINPDFLSLPPRLSPTVIQIAEELFAEAETPEEKIRVVEDYFNNNYTYDTATYIPRGVDHLSYFLTMRPAAHCEYFATASAILLRLGGVPARYVTGYVVTGKNPIDGNWIARQRDAHAWVEAYDETQQQWVIVESTPVEGIPSDAGQTTFNSAHTTGRGLWMWILEFFRSGILWRFIQMYARSFALLIPLGFLVLVFLGKLVKIYVVPWKKGERIDPIFVPLVHERLQMDRFLARRGLTRSAEESLLHFAARLQNEALLNTSSALADWYRQYVVLRFQELPLRPGDVQDIQRSRRQISRMTRVSR